MPDIDLQYIRVTRVGDSIFIPLPPELWRPAGDGQCCCDVCKVDGGDTGYWDTLAVEANPRDRHHDKTWTVHYPQLHDRSVRRAKIAADKEAR